MMSRFNLAKHLSDKTGKRVVLRLHRNKTSWLSFKQEKQEIHLALHENFLDGPPFVIEDVVSMLKGNQRLSAKSRAYLFSKDGNVPVNHIETLGEVWDLQYLYDEVVAEYFGDLDLSITWFGIHRKKSNKITLGQYDSSCRLIKIHRLLDSEKVPKFILKYIIYHEILHSVYAPQVHKKGFLSIHPKDFLDKEKEFKHYELSQQWMKENKQKLFFTRF
jgi:hypothetical protein